MTISGIQTTQPYAGPIAASTVLAVPFVFYDASDLVLYELDSLGAENLLVAGVHYSVAGGAGSTGSVTMLTGTVGAAETLFIVRRTARTQALDYQAQTTFPAASHEEALDRAAIRDQDLNYELKRSLRVRDTDPEPANLPSKANRIGKWLQFDANGDPQATDLSTTSVGVSAFMSGVLASADAAAALAALTALGSSGGQTISGPSLTITVAGVAFLSLDSTSLGAATYRNFRVLANALGVAGEHYLRKVRPDAGGADIDVRWPGSVVVSTLVDSAQDGGDLVHTGLYRPRNLLLNPSMRIWQVGGSGGTVIDGTADAVLGAGNRFDNNKHGPDGWKIFGGNPAGGANVNGVATWQRDDTAAGLPGQNVSARAILQIGARRFAIAQVIERRRMPQNVQNWSLAFQCRSTGGLLSSVNAAVICWATGDDAPDWPNLITSWVGGLTHGANWSKHSSTAFTPTNNWQRFAIENVTAAGAFSSAGNIGVLIWLTDDGGLVGEEMFITDVVLQPGRRVTPFQRIPIEEDYLLASRYFIKTFDEDIVPAEQSGSLLGSLVGRGASANASRALCHWNFPTTMRAIPTMRAYKPTAAGTAGRWSDDSAAATFQNTSRKCSQIIGNDAATEALIHATADARM